MCGRGRSSGAPGAAATDRVIQPQYFDVSGNPDDFFRPKTAAHAFKDVLLATEQLTAARYAVPAAAPSKDADSRPPHGTVVPPVLPPRPSAAQTGGAVEGVGAGAGAGAGVVSAAEDPAAAASGAPHLNVLSAVDASALLLEVELRGQLLVQQQHELERLRAANHSLWVQLAAAQRQLADARAGRGAAAPVSAAVSDVVGGARVRTPARGFDSIPPTASHEGPFCVCCWRRQQAKRRYWAPDEHKRFLEGMEKCVREAAAWHMVLQCVDTCAFVLRRFGLDSLADIAKHVGTRTTTQVRTHAQKFFQRKKMAEAAANGADTGAAPPAAATSPVPAAAASATPQDVKAADPGVPVAQDSAPVAGTPAVPAPVAAVATAPGGSATAPQPQATSK